MQLGIGHGPGFKPAVQHFLDSPISPWLSLPLESEMVHIFSVKVCHPVTRQLCELVNGTDAVH